MRNVTEQLAWEETQINSIKELDDEELLVLATSLSAERDELLQLQDLVSAEAARRYLTKAQA